MCKDDLKDIIEREKELLNYYINDMELYTNEVIEQSVKVDKLILEYMKKHQGRRTLSAHSSEKAPGSDNHKSI